MLGPVSFASCVTIVAISTKQFRRRRRDGGSVISYRDDVRRRRHGSRALPFSQKTRRGGGDGNHSSSSKLISGLRFRAKACQHGGKGAVVLGVEDGLNAGEFEEVQVVPANFALHRRHVGVTVI